MKTFRWTFPEPKHGKPLGFEKMKIILLVAVGIVALLTYPILYPNGGASGGWISIEEILAILASYPAIVLSAIGILTSVVIMIKNRRFSDYSVTLLVLSLIFPLALIYRYL